MDDTHYLLGSVMGPHPFPVMVRDFQSVIGKETKEQFFKRKENFLKLLLPVSVAGAMQWECFIRLLRMKRLRLYGVEAAGRVLIRIFMLHHLTKGSPGVLHGALMYLLQNDDGQIQEAHSISAGLDYPGVGPEHSYLNDSGPCRLPLDNRYMRHLKPSAFIKA